MDLIRIGSYEMYPGERLLKADGKPVELGARAFDLLLVLAENPGRLVTKAALIERVWPRLVVDENNLPAQIAGLRRILGPGAIRTVPRFGFPHRHGWARRSSAGHRRPGTTRDRAARSRRACTDAGRA
jgi:DNA-binding winged helix-turn-helix (wHTH) protein